MVPPIGDKKWKRDQMIIIKVFDAIAKKSGLESAIAFANSICVNSLYSKKIER